MWNKNGKIELLSEWRKGKPHGDWFYYEGTSEIKKKQYFKKGILIKEDMMNETKSKKKSRFLWRIFGKKKKESDGGEVVP